MTKQWIASIALLVLLGVVAGQPLAAQDGKIKMNVYPPETYVFVDGKAMGEATHSLMLSPGNHEIGFWNYGFKPSTHDVTITAGTTTHLKDRLEPITDMVSGPVGAITIEGANRDAILLNGTTPEHFVGHGDEFNHHWWWKQELIVPAGTHKITVVHQGNEIWSGEVEVPANKRVVLDVPKGVRKTVSWDRGEQHSPWLRFQSGIASTSVAVAKPSAMLSAQNKEIKCGSDSILSWSSKDAAQVEITPIGTVTKTGTESVRPVTTTTYELKASGPGGVATSATTVNVDKSVQAQLSLAQSEIRYKRVGDKVLEEGSSALNWSSANADSVSIDPIGFVNSSGSHPLQVKPQKTEDGPIDETVTYTLRATNRCGGDETRTATLHITGSIESDLALRSIFFPTDVPRPTGKNVGLTASQKKELTSIADAFKKHLIGTPDAHLVLFGHADERGPKAYNHALSERRTEVAKLFLIKQGVPEANIETFAYGEEQNLTTDEVKRLVESHPELSAQAKDQALGKMKTVVYAHNRRVDISLSTTGNASARHYPFTADDYATLVKRGPELKHMVVLAAERERM